MRGIVFRKFSSRDGEVTWQLSLSSTSGENYNVLIVVPAYILKRNNPGGRHSVFLRLMRARRLLRDHVRQLDAERMPAAQAPRWPHR